MYLIVNQYKALFFHSITRKVAIDPVGCQLISILTDLHPQRTPFAKVHNYSTFTNQLPYE